MHPEVYDHNVPLFAVLEEAGVNSASNGALMMICVYLGRTDDTSVIGILFFKCMLLMCLC